MIKLTAKNKELQEMFAAMRKVADEIRVNISQEGLTTKMVNPTNTAMLYLDLPKAIFNGFDVDESRTIGISLSEWYSAIQFNSPKELIEFELEIKKQFTGAQDTGQSYESITGVFKSLEGFEDAIAILDPAALRKEPKVLTTPKETKVTIPADRLRKILKKAAMIQKRSRRKVYSSIDHYIKFNVENGEFTTTHESDIRRGKSKTIATGEIEITGKAHACYSTFELIDIMQAIKDKTVTLEFADDYPLAITFKVLQHGTGRYLLAPRVESESSSSIRRRDTPQTVPPAAPQNTPQDTAQTSGQTVPPAAPQTVPQDPAQTSGQEGTTQEQN